MRKFVLIILVFLTGCTTAQIPQYLQADHPYMRRFYADFEQTQAAINQALTDLGWEIEKTTDPLVYEESVVNNLDGQKVLIMTKIRQTPLFLGTRYAKMNIYIRSKNKISEVEIRYYTVTSLPLRNLDSYRNDSAAERILKHIGEVLEQT